MLIGLTGTYCAGKNHIAAMLEAKGLPVLDVDKLGYQALETEKEAIFAQFGGDLQKADGSLNRRLLGQRVFGQPEKLAALEAIVHPPVNRLTDEWIGDRAQHWGQSSTSGTELNIGDRACVINAALLHKSTAFSRLDRIIVVTAPFFTRLLRAKRRDKLPWAAILRRFSSQADFNSQYLAGNAEIYIVENRGSGSRRSRRKLESRINEILEGI